MKDGGIMVIDKIEVDSRKFGYPLLVKAFSDIRASTVNLST